MLLPSFLSLHDTHSIWHLLRGVSFLLELLFSGCGSVPFSTRALQVGLPQPLLHGFILDADSASGGGHAGGTQLVLVRPIHSLVMKLAFFSRLKSCSCLRTLPPFDFNEQRHVNTLENFCPTPPLSPTACPFTHPGCLLSSLSPVLLPQDPIP